MNKKIRVLVITYLPWRNDTSVGNSYSNIFNGMDDRFEFAHIYFRDGMPENEIVHNYFHISEKGLMKSVFSRKEVGRAFYLEEPSKTEKVTFSKGYNRMRRLRWEIFLLARDMVGVLGKWKSKALYEFIEDFKPDVIFGTLGYVPVINKMMVHLKKKYNIPLITYPWDDYYSLKRVSFSPFFWIRNLSERPYIKKCAKNSEFLYTITKQMQEEYTKYFDKECKLLYKGYNFDDEFKEASKKSARPLNIVFMGNIGSGRWKVLAELAKSISQYNNGEKRMFMNIYTLSPVNEKMISMLNVEGASKLNDPVPNDQVLPTMNAADILLHVEPTTLKDRLFFRLSFSTKLVDYFYAGKCVLALGGDTSAMRYLSDEDAAIVELDKSKFLSVLKRIDQNPHLIGEYEKKAWLCGKRNHDIKTIQNKIWSDFYRTVNKENSDD